MNGPAQLWKGAAHSRLWKAKYVEYHAAPLTPPAASWISRPLGRTLGSSAARYSTRPRTRAGLVCKTRMKAKGGALRTTKEKREEPGPIHAKLLQAAEILVHSA